MKYKEIFLSCKTEFIPEGTVGCALTCAPYVVLAKEAVPPDGAASMLSMTVEEWDGAVS